MVCAVWQVVTKQGHTALMVAVGMGRLDAAAMLLDAGANPNARVKLKKSSRVRAGLYGRTVLQHAVDSGNPDVVAALLQSGADPLLEGEGSMALHVAAEKSGEVGARMLALMISSLQGGGASPLERAAGGGGYLCNAVVYAV